MKRLKNAFIRIAVLVAVLLCAAVLPTEVNAETEGYYTYSVTDGKATITDVDTSISGDVVIPDTLGGYPVTSIGEYAFYRCEGLNSVTLPNGITSIGKDTFGFCTGLVSVNIPNSVTSIDDWAFYYCSALTSITIPDGVTSIGASAFKNCSNLTSVTIPDGVTSIGADAFYDCGRLTNISIPNSVTSIGASAFGGCSSLTSVTIPDGVTSIGSQAFSSCSSLRSITIPNSVASIGAATFSNCSNLNYTTYGDGKYLGNENNPYLYLAEATATIHANTKFIGYSAFSSHSNLQEISIPDGVISIGASAFRDCSVLTTVTIPDSVTSIGDNAFRGCSSLTNITIPDSVNSIGKYAFMDCSSLTNITIPNSATSIGNGAFQNCSGLTTVNYNAINCTTMGSDGNPVFKNCTNLTTVNIGKKTTQIPSYAFYDCTGLTAVHIKDIAAWCNISFKGDNSNPLYYAKNLYLNDELVTDLMIPDNVTSIGSNVFRNCTALTSITIPNSVTSIGNRAFYGCTGLTSITLPESVTTIGDEAFWECAGLTEITIPKGVTSIGYSAFVGTSLVVVNYNATNCTQMGEIDRPVFVHSLSIKTVNIGDNVESIPDYAFSTCRGLPSIAIPEGITSIGSGAFTGCNSLADITIPDSVTSIGAGAFSGCTALREINIPNGVEIIGDEAFWVCTNLTEVTIPDSVTSIGHTAFSGCTGLTAITIPESVTDIGEYAFSNCTGLTTVYYGGTEEQKANMTVGDGNDPLLNATWVYEPVEETTSTIIKDWGLTLEDEVVVKFNMIFTPEILEDANAYVEVQVGGTTTKVPVSTVVGPLQVAVNAAQMTDLITLCIVDGNGGRSESNSFTVRQYCQSILADEKYADYHDLVKEMLNYGSAAQMYFGHNTGDLAGEGMTDVGQEEVPETTNSASSADESYKIDYIGAALVLRDKVAVRYYFTGDLKGASFMAGGIPYEMQKDSNGSYVEVAGIDPQNLDKEITLTVTDSQGKTLSVTYCPMNYIVRMNQKGSSAIKSLVKALYNYHFAAKAYTNKAAA